MIVDQELRKELVKEFEKFGEEGECCGTCFKSCIGQERLEDLDIENDCSACSILFPKLRLFWTENLFDETCFSGGTRCMCHFLKTKDFKASVKKAWRYINGEWG
jgi:hypothetical protein